MNFRLLALASLAIAPLPGFSGSACVDGEAAGYECQNVDLVAHMSLNALGGGGVNDIWGWTGSDGLDYALVGTFNGTVFVRINADGSLTRLGMLPASDGQTTANKAQQKSCHDEACGGGSSWRDIKVHNNYAYIISEAAGHGMQIFDLTQLVGATSQSWGETAYVGDFGHAHNIFINEDTGHAFVVGNGPVGSTNNGGLYYFDLSNPLNPPASREINDDGYTHDVQCVDYSGPDTGFQGREICFASNEDTLTIIDVEDVNAPDVLSKASYSGSQYTHQAWLSEDQRYIFLNDELDEAATGGRTHLRVFDVSNLAAPAHVADYLAPTLAIDHNNYTHGDWLYQTNYLAGFRILDVSDPENPVQAAYFDTKPGQDSAAFDGTWSNFRFDSGRVALSDMSGGLFVVQPTLAAANGSDLAVGMSASPAAPEADETVEVELLVENLGTADVTGVLVTAHLPAGLSFEVSDAAGASCNMAGRVIECRIASLAAGGTWTGLLDFSSASSGAVDAYVMAYGEEQDAASADNLAKTTVSFSAPPATGGGGGGGGGSLAWLLLLPLLGFRRRRA